MQNINPRWFLVVLVIVLLPAEFWVGLWAFFSAIVTGILGFVFKIFLVLGILFGLAVTLETRRRKTSPRTSAPGPQINGVDIPAAHAEYAEQLRKEAEARRASRS